MGLTVKYTGSVDLVLKQDVPDSWCVLNPHEILDGQEAVVVSGFARKEDAEMACAALEKTQIDWQAPSDEIDRQWNEYGGREEIWKTACAALQW